MLSDDELLNHDASDNLFIRETPREDSPRTLTRHLINRFGLSSKGGTETVTNNTQSSSGTMKILSLKIIKVELFLSLKSGSMQNINKFS